MTPRSGISGYADGRRKVQCAIGLVLLFFATLVPAVFAQPAATKAPRTILVMGDSLSAAYGLSASQGWVALTAERIGKSHPGWKMVNASISGETTAGGAARIDAELKRHRPAVVVIELGANDGLRGLPLAQSRTNLERMIKASKAAGAKVLLVGMRMPPNYGREYTQGFERTFRDLSQQHKTAFVPFLLEPVAFDDRAFQADRIHPTAEAHPTILANIYPSLRKMLP